MIEISSHVVSPIFAHILDDSLNELHLKINNKTQQLIAPQKDLYIFYLRQSGRLD
jgi:hypothetical protein